MQKIYHVDLTPKQRKDLKKLVRYGRTKAQVITNAHILLKADEDKTDEEIASLQYVGIETVRRVRQRYWKQGLDHALNGNPYPPREPKLSDEPELPEPEERALAPEASTPGGICPVRLAT
mgnify:CR=1 FL=1